MSEERVPTGIAGLDERIGGGLPKGSLTLVGGEPGSGKTTFSAQFLHHGASALHDPSVYVSFGESHKVFYSNMRLLGLNFEECEQSFKYLDFMRMKSGADEILTIIMKELEQTNARRLVIDSFTTLCQTIKDPSEQPVVMDTILSKIMREMGCTTILTVEKKVGQPWLGSGFEAFVADGIITLERDDESGIRRIRIPKLRGTKLPQTRFLYSLYHGFRLIPPLSRTKLLVSDRKLSKFYSKLEGSMKKPWTPVPHTETRFSTGNLELDKIANRGFEKGAYVILEVERDVPPRAVKAFTFPLMWNFISQGHGVIYYLGQSTSGEEIKAIASSYIEAKTFDKLARVFEDKPPNRRLTSHPYTVAMTGGKKSLDHDAELFQTVSHKLMKITKKNVLSIISYAELENKYAGNIEKLFSHIGDAIGENMTSGNVTFAIARPGLAITDKVLNITRWHLRLIERDGAVLFYGIRPRINLHAVEIDESGDQVKMLLTPML
jgi:KaiC/GvpD/RAD55 family RecA-like ATPase